MNKEDSQEIKRLEMELDTYFASIQQADIHLRNKIKYYLHSKGYKKLMPLVQAALMTNNWIDVKKYVRNLW
ncbi:MAG TPA: hypothetical protein P5136_01665 [Methanofastidiosum sp.]|nr:hypothetical protein [Methanofastidiosum sp.]